jgi:F0F1-type ATP synthase membrane subunit a
MIIYLNISNKLFKSFFTKKAQVPYILNNPENFLNKLTKKVNFRA